MLKNGEHNKHKYKKYNNAKKVIMFCFAFLLTFLVPIAVFAGSINGNESSVISAASGTFTYNGRHYRSTSGSLSSLRAYLSKDNVDLTAAQASRAISIMYSNIGNGIDDGYLVPIDGEEPSPSPTDEPSAVPSATPSPQATLTNADKTKNTEAVNAGGNTEAPSKTNETKAKIVTDNEKSGLTVKDKSGNEIYSANFPVKQTGFSLSGIAVFGVVLALAACVCAVIILKKKAGSDV